MADVIAIVCLMADVNAMADGMSLNFMWLMLVPLCFLWLMLLPKLCDVADVITTWQML